MGSGGPWPRRRQRAWWAPKVRAALGESDLVVLNLECYISERGRPWDAPGKPFSFRAPPRAVELLVLLGAACVTLANNHALDYGVDALGDTLKHLAGAGIAAVGAGPDLERARRPATIAAGGLRVAVLGVTDHPPDFAAGCPTGWPKAWAEPMAGRSHRQRRPAAGRARRRHPRTGRPGRLRAGLAATRSVIPGRVAVVTHQLVTDQHSQRPSPHPGVLDTVGNRPRSTQAV